MAAGDIIQLLGIVISSIISITSLVLQLKNHYAIKQIVQKGKNNISDSTNSKSSSFEANAKNDAVICQVGGNMEKGIKI